MDILLRAPFSLLSGSMLRKIRPFDFFFPLRKMNVKKPLNKKDKLIIFLHRHLNSFFIGIYRKLTKMYYTIKHKKAY